MWTEQQVQALLFYEDLIPAIRKALMDFSAGRVVQPLRTILRSEAAGLVLCPRCTAGDGRQDGHFLSWQCGARKAYAYGDDPTFPFRYRRAPGHHGRAIDHRDAHGSGVRGGHRPPCSGGGESARHPGQWGAGALPHPSTCWDPSFTEIRVWSRTPDHAQQFASEIGGG